MRPLLLALLVLAACGKDAAAPSFGTIVVQTSASCASSEDVQVWVDDTDKSGGRATILYPGELAIANVPTGARRVDIFRWRYATEGNMTATVKTGALTTIRLDCPDGYTITNP